MSQSHVVAGKIDDFNIIFQIFGSNKDLVNEVFPLVIAGMGLAGKHDLETSDLAGDLPQPFFIRE